MHSKRIQSHQQVNTKHYFIKLFAATLDDLPVLDFLSADFSMPEPSSHCMVEGQRVLAKCGSNDETTAREWDIDLKQNYSLNSIEREILALESDSSMLCI